MSTPQSTSPSATSSSSSAASHPAPSPPAPRLERIQTGISELDSLLGGGLLPGTLTVVAGATGVGKTQLGLQFAQHGERQEGERGILFDMTTRGDSQNHLEYARRLSGWDIRPHIQRDELELSEIWDRSIARRDYLQIFDRSGRRVTRNDLEFEDWKEWKVELVRKLRQAIWFFYGNFVHGARRCVIDGVEPTDKPSDSFQFDLFEYIYHQILHKEADWVARDLLREHFRVNADSVARHHYDHRQIACVLLLTTREILLDDLLQRPLDTGDVLSNANTIILMGKTRDGGKMGRALHIPKHRGSYCDDSIVPFEITSSGLKLKT